MKVVTPRQQDRINRILECTRQQIARLGYDGVNMRELALEADVSTATLYNLFNSKDELILAASQELLAGANRISESAVGIGRVIKRHEAIADTIVANPNYAEAMGRMLFAADPSAPVVDQLIGQSKSVYEAELDKMQKLGELVAEVDVERLARDLAGGGWSIILLWMKGFIALHDFKVQYRGNAIALLLPWLTADLQSRYRTRTGVMR